jgi:hypothetical protein
MLGDPISGRYLTDHVAGFPSMGGSINRALRLAREDGRDSESA